MKSKLLLYTSPFILVNTSQAINNEKATDKPVNVIYILADDLGYGDLGCYGQQKIKTPHIDRMAAEGMLFTQHYAGCTVSAPSRASLMTGLHTGHTQIRGNKEIKPEGQQAMQVNTYTLGKLMKSANYTTGIFGKWGLGYPGSDSEPNKMGFDEFYGYNCQREAHSYYPEHLWHNGEKVILLTNENRGMNIYSQDLIHEKAIRFIRDNKQKPFFAMLTYTLPHAELNLPHDSIYQQYENLFAEKPYDGKNGYYDVEKPHASFAAMVTRLDMYVGEILDELKKQGLDKNTLVIFTSDNGPHREGGADPDFFNSYGPLKGIKRDLYEGGIRVPMIAWMPEKIAANTRSEHISAFWDVMPTLAELSNIKLPTKTDGISMLPTLFSNNRQKEHEYLYWEFHELGGRQAIRKGDWKAIRLNVGTPERTAVELYNLKNDLHEDNNLAKDNPEILEELILLIDRARTESELFNFGK